MVNGVLVLDQVAVPNNQLKVVQLEHNLYLASRQHQHGECEGEQVVGVLRAAVHPLPGGHDRLSLHPGPGRNHGLAGHGLGSGNESDEDTGLIADQQIEVEDVELELSCKVSSLVLEFPSVYLKSSQAHNYLRGLLVLGQYEEP